MQVYGWDAGGMIVFDDVSCTNNTALNNGGSFYALGRAAASNGTVMHDNVARNGGCICERAACAIWYSIVTVLCGQFECRPRGHTVRHR